MKKRASHHELEHKCLASRDKIKYGCVFVRRGKGSAEENETIERGLIFFFFALILRLTVDQNIVTLILAHSCLVSLFYVSYVFLFFSFRWRLVNELRRFLCGFRGMKKVSVSPGGAHSLIPAAESAGHADRGDDVSGREIRCRVIRSGEEECERRLSVSLSGRKIKRLAHE